MAFTPQNFQNMNTPAVSAAFLNGVDVTCNFVLGGAQTVPAALAALGLTTASTITLPVPIPLGGTGQVTASAALSALGGITLAAVTNSYVGGLIYPPLAIEGASVVQPWYPYGRVDRYEVNASPGVTDMSAGWQTSLTIAQTAVLSGQSGINSSFGAGAYLINTPPSLTPFSTNQMIPVDIGGVGLGTVLYCGASGTGGLISLFSGCRLHDMQIVSAAGTSNNGVLIITTAGSQPIGVLVERVYSRMQGIGFLLQNCNSVVLRDCWHWNDKAPALPIAISPAGSSVNHGIYATGGFVHDVSVYDFRGAVSVNYAAGQRWIKNDCTNSFNFRIWGGTAVNESPSNSQKLLELGNASGGSHIVGAVVAGVNHQNGFLEFNDVTDSSVYSNTDGGGADVGGVGLNFQLNSLANSIGPNSENAALSFDASSGANVVTAGSYGSTVDNATVSPNFYNVANRSASYGGLIENPMAYSTSMTPNMTQGTRIRVVAIDANNWTLNAPTNLQIGLVSVAVLNTTGAPLGVGTFAPIYKIASSTPTLPGSLKQRCWLFFFDGTNLTLVGNEPTADTGY